MARVISSDIKLFDNLFDAFTYAMQLKQQNIECVVIYDSLNFIEFHVLSTHVILQKKRLILDASREIVSGPVVFSKKEYKCLNGAIYNNISYLAANIPLCVCCTDIT